jgi:N-acetyl-gamma-glutamyl-phosphate reductase
VRYCDAIDEGGFIAGNGLSGKDSMEITVSGNDDRILLVARYDNLGKGASGAAIQCMNLITGCGETTSLAL